MGDVKQAQLLPAESMALTVALAQVQRGEEPTPNVALVCVLALARLAGRDDYTAREYVVDRRYVEAPPDANGYRCRHLVSEVAGPTDDFYECIFCCVHCKPRPSCEGEERNG